MDLKTKLIIVLLAVLTVSCSRYQLDQDIRHGTLYTTISDLSPAGGYKYRNMVSIVDMDIETFKIVQKEEYRKGQKFLKMLEITHGSKPEKKK